MQTKLGAGFLLVALLYVLVGLGVSWLELNPLAAVTLTASSYAVVGLGAAWFISRLLSRRMRALAAAAAMIRDGDLTRRIDTSGNDEIADVARSFAVMAESLLNVLQRVRLTAETINASARRLSVTSDAMSASSQEITGTTDAIARGVEQQATQVLQISETTRELIGVANSVRECADSVNHSAGRAASDAEVGGDDARRAAEVIEALTRKNLSASELVEGFRDKASEIGELINSITSISHQTHLLAINAAIEAARAGEEGRGFGVVADEVGRLADAVRRFAKQISSISVEILQGSERVAEQFRRNGRAVAVVSGRVEHTVDSFGEILGVTSTTATQAAQILSLTERQQRAVSEVGKSLDRISRVAEQNARDTAEAAGANRGQRASMREMSRSAHDLEAASVQLKELVTIFKLPLSAEVERGSTD
jgi:methyl-accepting chemotaxis protein